MSKLTQDILKMVLGLLIIFSLIFASAHLDAGNIEPYSHGYKPAQVECLSLNIYHEARDQIQLGWYVVAFVTMNRKNDKRWPNNICDVVTQPAQFSWYNPENMPRIKWEDPIEVAAWIDIQQFTQTFLVMYEEGYIEDFTGGADHYHRWDVNPDWANDPRVEYVMTVGDHLVYTSAW